MDKFLVKNEERKAPTFTFPAGINPPVTQIERIVSGQIVQITLNYRFHTPASLINFRGWTPNEWNARNGNPPVGTRRSVENRLTSRVDDIDIKTYIKEQQEIIANQNRIDNALRALPAEPRSHRKQREQKILLKWRNEIEARRNVPSQYWEPYTRNYELLLPQYAHESED